MLRAQHCRPAVSAQDNRILDIVNNFEKISFNVGPTLLSWLDRHAPDVYRSILEADRRSAQAHGGHGNAIAQVYNHMILPLASRRDKVHAGPVGATGFSGAIRARPRGNVAAGDRRRQRVARGPRGGWE